MQDSNRTKNILAQALKDLMQKEPFNKISIGDICAACGMNRKSFYYHFEDKYDLVNWIFQKEFIETIQEGETANAWELFDAICRYFYREQSFYRNLLQVEGPNEFSEYFGRMLEPIFFSIFGDIFSAGQYAMSQQEMAFMIVFFSDAFLATIERWLREGAKMPPEQYSAMIKKTVIAMARQTVSEADKRQG